MSDSQIANPLAAFEEYELVEFMALRKTDEETANQAFIELEKRFRKVIFEALQRICAPLSKNQSLVKTLYSNTFYNAYMHADSFRMQEGVSPQVRYKLTFGWLLSIAKGELKFMLSNKEKKTELRLLFPRPGDGEDEEDLYGVMLSNARASPRKLTYKEEIVAKAIEQIPKERDREIFHTYWLFYRPNMVTSKKFPDNASATLASEYNTTKENVRQIISRSLKIVRKYLEEHYKK